MAGCHKKSMSIIFEIPLCRISMSCENRCLQDIKCFFYTFNFHSSINMSKV
jgi:hypothetical protein